MYIAKHQEEYFSVWKLWQYLSTNALKEYYGTVLVKIPNLSKRRRVKTLLYPTLPSPTCPI